MVEAKANQEQETCQALSGELETFKAQAMCEMGTLRVQAEQEMNALRAHMEQERALFRAKLSRGSI